jgi:hypothetical protein
MGNLHVPILLYLWEHSGRANNPVVGRSPGPVNYCTEIAKGCLLMVSSSEFRIDSVLESNRCRIQEDS